MWNLREAIRAKTDAVKSQTTAQTNKTRTGTRHDASISAGGTGGSDVDDEAAELIEERAQVSNRTLGGREPTPDPSQEGYVFTVRAKNWHGARDSSRRNAGPADPRWEIAMPFRQPTFLRTKVRAPIAVPGETVNTYQEGN